MGLGSSFILLHLLFIPDIIFVQFSAVSTHGEDPTVPGKKIHNIQPIKKLLHWLTVTEYENYEQQVKMQYLI